MPRYTKINSVVVAQSLNQSGIQSFFENLCPRNASVWSTYTVAAFLFSLSVTVTLSFVRCPLFSWAYIHFFLCDGTFFLLSVL